MRELIGLIGREAMIEKAVGDLKKGRHVLFTGPAGVGKSSVLGGALKALGEIRTPPLAFFIDETQPKAQFVDLARQLLAAGVVTPQALELAERYHGMAPDEIEWAEIRRAVNRISIRDLAGAIIPAIHEYDGRVLIAVDDLSDLTPTMGAFWSAILEKAQVSGCASQKKRNLARLYWKLTEHPVPPLPEDQAKRVVIFYMARTGMMVEDRRLLLGHVVKQSGGNPQAIADMLTDAGRERVVDRRKIREMAHAAGVNYLDFTPVVIICTAGIVGTRYLAMGIGDKALYILAGLAAAVLLSVRVFIFKGAGRAN